MEHEKKCETNCFINYEEFGKRISELRKKHGLTQEKLAERIFLTESAVKKLEHGERHASLETMEALKTTLNVTSDFLLWGISEKSSTEIFLKKFYQLPNEEQCLIIKELFNNLIDANFLK